MKICPKCGKENSNNSKYCTSCRANLSLGGKTESSDSTPKAMVLLAGVLAIVFIAGGTVLFIRSKSDTNSATSITVSAEPEPETTPQPEPEPEPESVLAAYVLPSVLPEQFYSYQGHTYGFYDTERLGLNTYREVADFCTSQGGHLAVINDQGENNYLFGLVRDNYANTAFFGYSDEESEGNWMWEGENNGFENWTVYGQHQPDNGSGYGGDEDYAEFNYKKNTNSPNDGTWNDAPFRDNTNLFICEWDYDIEDVQQ